MVWMKNQQPDNPLSLLGVGILKKNIDVKIQTGTV